MKWLALAALLAGFSLWFTAEPPGEFGSPRWLFGICLLAIGTAVLGALVLMSI